MTEELTELEEHAEHAREHPDLAPVGRQERAAQEQAESGSDRRVGPLEGLEEHYDDSTASFRIERTPSGICPISPPPLRD